MQAGLYRVVGKVLAHLSIATLACKYVVFEESSAAAPDLFFSVGKLVVAKKLKRQAGQTRDVLRFMVDLLVIFTLP